ncbi:hypothetical protein ABL78_7551 [Leptomonas seymouri]|uniref:Uncharacterized protein n=1 Tax=Leptomonas seymouri TaxID=5684 RepID=A0A0N1I1T2_LEPSE|nr:hypothetical protein ABL78_7551 [Leptomonas seymouri]|eukprot:KPI83414.1 hypothetical protein ABL78_7551 [Leptomonas seymouri]
MSSVTEKSFQLHSIQLCAEDTTSRPSVTQPHGEVEAAGPAAANDPLSALLSTTVLLEIGGGDSASPLRYRCPAYIAQRSSVTLRDLLEDSLENVESTVKVTSGQAAEAETATPLPSSSSYGSSLVIPLPFVRKEVFEVVAVFMEHFYGLPGWVGSTSTAEPSHVADALSGSRRLSDAASIFTTHNAALTQTTNSLTALRRPLNFTHLYALAPWTHHFVLHCLLGLTWQQITLLELAKEARWVDLAGGSSDKRTGGLRTSPEALAAFSLENRQRMWTRLSAILEAATRLGVLSLQQLCAGVAANMIVDLDANSLAQLLKGDGERTVAPFSPEARADLLQRFPWLSREPKTASGPVVK